MPPVVVVGGGIAGLVCATELARAGQSVLVLEAAENVGGRVRTTWIGGNAIDYGFQVLFTAYPTLASYLDINALALRPFRPAAHIITQNNASLIGDALRDPSLLLNTLSASALTIADKFRLLALRRFARALSIDECFSAQFRNVSTREFLVERGFSHSVIDGFFVPFYGGILLDRTLATSASVLIFTFKMLSEGDTALPANGMAAIPTQLASKLPGGSVRTSARVQSLCVDSGRVVAVVLDDGELINASDVVIATEPAAASALAATANVHLTEQIASRGSTSLYFTANSAPLPGRSLWLNGASNAVISHAVTLTEVVPEYAQGKHLLVATAVGESANLPDSQLDEFARRELSQMSTVGNVGLLPALTRVAIMRVPFSQFAQPPGFTPAKPEFNNAPLGLWRASELMHSSSLEGAARGGQTAARALLARNAGT